MRKPNLGAHKRGRKAGGDVLRTVGASTSALKSAELLAFGRNAHDPAAKLVRTWRAIARANRDLAKREGKLLATLMGTARPAFASIKPSPVQRAKSTEEQRAMRRELVISQHKWDADAHRKLATIETTCQNLPPGESEDFLKERANADAVRYWRDKRRVEGWLHAELSELTLAVRANMELGKAEWFRKVAAAIEAEVTSDGRDVYPLHAAILSLGQLEYTTSEQGLRCYHLGAPLDPTPRYTISKVCQVLEDRGFRVPGQGDDDWERTVRRACRKVKFPLVASKPGPKPGAT